MPMDEEELKNLDTPAFIRQNLNILNDDLSEKEEETVTNENDDFFFENFSMDDAINKPTFLRKVQGES